MTDVLNESAADKQVIKSLLNKIKELQNAMSHKLLFDENGDLYIAHHFEKIEAAALDAEVKKSQDEIDAINTIKSAAEKLKQSATAPEPTAAPAEAPVVEATPEVTPEATPVEQVDEHVDPAVQPAAAPAPVILQ